MLLQVVLVIVAPFGITRIASAVANCSDGPWALWLACHRQEPWIPEGGSPSTATRFASLGPEGGLLLSVYTERFQVTAVLSSTATPAPALALRPWFSVGFAGWTRCRDWRWRQQPCGLNGKTSRPPCGIEGNHHEGDRFRTLCRPGQSTGRDQDCGQNSHRAIFADPAALCRHVRCVLSAQVQCLLRLWSRKRRGR